MAFEVRITPKAEQDADAILDWLIAEHAGETGLRWFLKLEEVFNSLTELPNRCKLAPEDKNFPFEVRELLYGRRSHVYRILFTIKDNIVFVVAIRHGHRLPLVAN